MIEDDPPDSPVLLRPYISTHGATVYQEAPAATGHRVPADDSSIKAGRSDDKSD
jgi:hypothetical protein